MHNFYWTLKIKRTEEKKLCSTAQNHSFQIFFNHNSCERYSKTLQRNYIICIEHKFDLFYTLFLTWIEDNPKDLADVQKKSGYRGGGLLVCVVFLLCISVSVIVDKKKNLSKTTNFLRS